MLNLLRALVDGNDQLINRYACDLFITDVPGQERTIDMQKVRDFENLSGAKIEIAPHHVMGGLAGTIIFGDKKYFFG